MEPTLRGIEVTVIVTIVSGAESVRRCLRSLLSDGHPAWLEVLVPVERERADVAVLSAEFDAVRFVDLGPMDSEVDPHDPCAEHRRFDLRRAGGLRAASGAIVAMLEDHGTPCEGFVRLVVDAHRDNPSAAIGGGVGCRSSHLRHYALWMCDFSRHLAPVRSGATKSLSDVNVSYKRTAILDISPTWRAGFHEPDVHGALLAIGGLSRDATLQVEQERPMASLRSLFAERMMWGRHFGRGRLLVPSRWITLFYLPAVLLASPWFAVRTLLRARSHLPPLRLLACAPLVFVFTFFWAVGEGRGVIERRLS